MEKLETSVRGAEVALSEPQLDLRLLYTDHPVGDDPVMLLCPHHNDHTPSLAVYRDHLHCYGCGWHESARRHLQREGQEAELFLPHTSSVPKQRATLSDEQLQEMVETYARRLRTSGKAQYFLERGLTAETIDQAKLGYTGRAYTIPIWGRDRHLQTVRFRRDDTLGLSGPKYWGVPGRNGVCLFVPGELHDPLIWCEGELDALLAHQCGYSALSLTNGIGADPVDVADQLCGITDVRIAVDNDRAGYMRSRELGRDLHRLLGCKVWYCRFGAKDLTELYLKDGEDALRKVLG